MKALRRTTVVSVYVLRDAALSINTHTQALYSSISSFNILNCPSLTTGTHRGQRCSSLPRPHHLSGWPPRRPPPPSPHRPPSRCLPGDIPPPGLVPHLVNPGAERGVRDVPARPRRQFAAGGGGGGPGGGGGRVGGAGGGVTAELELPSDGADCEAHGVCDGGVAGAARHCGVRLSPACSATTRCRDCWDV
jgi:hypothetical protein